MCFGTSQTKECGINYIEPDNVGNATHRIVGGFEARDGNEILGVIKLNYDAGNGDPMHLH